MSRPSGVPGSANVAARGHRCLQRFTGATYGLAFALIIGAGHRFAGGRLPQVPDTLLWLAVTAGIGAALSGLRWSFPRLVAMFIAVQPLAHLVLSGRVPLLADVHGTSAPHPAAMMMDHTGGSPAAMMSMHAGGAVLTAVVVRFGWIWLSTMPLMLEAVMCLARRVVAWPLTVIGRTPPAHMRGVTPSVAKVWRSRGPPCGVNLPT